MALCSHCRNTLIRSLRQPRASSLRFASTAPATLNAAAVTPPPPTAPSSSPAVISSSKPARSQPFSTPPAKPAASVIKTARPKKGPRIPSKIPGGGVLQGLGYTKASPTVLAKEDDEYPPWLWTLLDQPKADGTEVAKTEVAGMSKKQRHKYDRKQERLKGTMPKPIPLHEQSADLTAPGDDAFVSIEKRAELTKSARVARRKGIREANFLRSM